jgi:hypothetical protein
MKDCPSTPCSPSSEYTGTLRIGEPHPSAREALRHVAELGYMRQLTLMESFSSCAIEGNRLAEVCVETLRRVMYCEPVSDRYILGLAWAIRSMDFSENVEVKRGAEVSAKDATSPPSLLPSCCASSFEGGGK